MTDIESIRKSYNSRIGAEWQFSDAGDPFIKLTPLPFILKALSQTFLRFPKLKSHLHVSADRSNPQITIKAAHNFGLAIDTTQGLLVAVLRNVESHSVVSLAAEIKRLSDLTQKSRLKPQDFQDATFTVSNIGSIGGSSVSLIIVAPMIGILGVGRVENVPTFCKDGNGLEIITSRRKAVLS